MRVAQTLLVTLLAGCFQPSPPEGAPCTKEGTCPSPLVCDQGLCVRTPRDASTLDERDAPSDTTRVDAAIARRQRSRHVRGLGTRNSLGVLMAERRCGAVSRSPDGGRR